MTTQDTRLYDDAFRTYGEPTQLLVACEELGELVQAISKVNRYGNHGDARLNLTEEIADTFIVIEQLMHRFNISEDAVSLLISKKKNRLRQRLDERKN